MINRKFFFLYFSFELQVVFEVRLCINSTHKYSIMACTLSTSNAKSIKTVHCVLKWKKLSNGIKWTTFFKSLKSFSLRSTFLQICLLVGYLVFNLMNQSFELEDKSSSVQKYSPFLSFFAALKVQWRQNK